MEERVLELLDKLDKEKEQEVAQLVKVRAQEIEENARRAYEAAKKEGEELCRKTIDERYEPAKRYLSSLLPEKDEQKPVEELTQEQRNAPEDKLIEGAMTFGGVL